MKNFNSDTSRRDFIKKAALGAGMLGLSAMGMSAKSYGRIMGSNDRVQVGIIGFSNRFRDSLVPSFMNHAKDLNFEFVAVSDIWNRRRDEAEAYIKQKTDQSIRKYRNNDELYAGRC